MSTLEGAHAWAAGQQLYFLAVNFALARGEREVAAAHLAKALARLPRARERCETWGRCHGLLRPA